MSNFAKLALSMGVIRKPKYRNNTGIAHRKTVKITTGKGGSGLSTYRLLVHPGYEPSSTYLNNVY